MAEYRAKRDADRARVIAAQVLEEVTCDGAFANLVLPKALRAEQSSNPHFTFRDAAFTSELVYGTLRQRAYLDTVIEHFSTRPLRDLDPIVLEVLRIGVYQLLFMRVPDHAAVAETVDVARQLSTDGPAKMVNAILRSVTRTSPEQIAEIFDSLPSGDTRLAARYSHPIWMVDVFRQALLSRGVDQAELEAQLQAALSANNETPRVNLIARPGLIEPAELAEEVEEVLGRTTSQGVVSEYAVLMDGGDPGALPSLHAGTSAVQDEGSQLAALLLAEAPLQGPDHRWLDLCAGPGGKTALLGALGLPRTVEIVANEVNPKRAGLVKRSVKALSNVEVICSDGRNFDTKAKFDRVLVDAPCSGLGSLRRRPESRWNHQPDDLEELIPLQRDLLRAGVQMTRAGGVIAYVTCTPDVRETVEQVQWALDHLDVDLIDSGSLAQSHVLIDLGQAEVVAEAAGEADQGSLAQVAAQTVQLWPHLHGTDAMFISLMRKTEEHK